MPHAMYCLVTTSSPSSALISSNSCLATWPHRPHESLWLVRSSRGRRPSRSRGMVRSITSVRSIPSWLRSGVRWSTMTSSFFLLATSSSPRTSPSSLLLPLVLQKYQCWFRYVYALCLVYMCNYAYCHLSIIIWHSNIWAGRVAKLGCI